VFHTRARSGVGGLERYAQKMKPIGDYIANYATDDSTKTDFAWNEKHAEEFEDCNQDFRQAVVEACIDEPSTASTELLQHLFIEEAKWAREAWGSPRNFGQLGQLLLERATEEAVRTFATGMNYSFDTFGACHEITLSASNLEAVTEIVDTFLATESDDQLRPRYESVKELLAKIGEGSATEGWVKIAPVTPVTNVRVVKPPLLHRLLDWLTGRTKQNKA